jgi:hypothetical protein
MIKILVTKIVSFIQSEFIIVVVGSKKMSTTVHLVDAVNLVC